METKTKCFKVGKFEYVDTDINNAPLKKWEAVSDGLKIDCKITHYFSAGPETHSATIIIDSHKAGYYVAADGDCFKISGGGCLAGAEDCLVPLYRNKWITSACGNWDNFVKKWGKRTALK